MDNNQFSEKHMTENGDVKKIEELKPSTQRTEQFENDMDNTYVDPAVVHVVHGMKDGPLYVDSNMSSERVIKNIEEETDMDRCLSSDGFDDFLRTQKPIWQRQRSNYTNGIPILLQLLDLRLYSLNTSTIADLSNQRNLLINAQPCGNVIRLYGVDHTGTSISVNVYEFSSYFFMSIPHSFPNEKCIKLIELINVSLSKSISNAVSRFDVVVEENVAENLPSQSRKMLKLFIFDQSFVLPVCNFIKSQAGKLIPGFNCEVFEEDINLLERFLCDLQIHGCSWVEIKSDHYNILSSDKKQTTCQLELEVSYEAIVCKDYDSGYNLSDVPVRLLGYDIECYNRDKQFSNSKCDPVIAIGNVIRDVRKTNDKEQKVVFVLGNSLLIKDADVLCFKSERDLLLSWKRFLEVTDPDAFVGYNIKKFDFEYLKERAKTLNIEDYENFSRNIKFSKGMESLTVDGRIVFDMLDIVKKECPYLYPRNLKNVCNNLLHCSKDDVDRSLIGKMYDSSLRERHTIYSYCLKDAILPILLFDRLNIFQKYLQLVKMTRLPLADIVKMSKTNNNHFSFPPLLVCARELTQVVKKSITYWKDDNLDWGETNKLWSLNYKLFLSIIIERNLCFHTFIQEEHVKNIPSDMYNKSPCGDFFFTHRIRQGIFPRMLLKLTIQLKMNKRKLEKEKDKEKRKEICCKIVAIESILKSFPFMLSSKFSLSTRVLILKNVIAFNKALTADEKFQLEKKNF